MLACAVAFGQSFEVASFKRLPAGIRGSFKTGSVHGRLMFRLVTLGDCIRWAYDLQPYQIVGPAWMEFPTDVTYEIDAKAAGPVPDSQLKLMLRGLLAERLKLALHREQRDVPVYVMVVGKGGPKLQRSKTVGEGQVKINADGVVIAEGITMARLTSMYGPPTLSLPLIDETNHPGAFDFQLDWVRYWHSDPSPERDAKGAVNVEPYIIQALSEQLGLKVERRHPSIRVLVIDHVEKDPVAN